MISKAEESYIKTIYEIQFDKKLDIVTNKDLSEKLQHKPPSVSEMIKKLKKKGYIDYIPYKGAILTPKSKKIAINLIRKQRLWESFLVNQLEFKWDEVEELSEELEHLKNTKLTGRLEQFLNFPKFSPKGLPIPDFKGEFEETQGESISDFKPNSRIIITGFKTAPNKIITELKELELEIGSKCKIINFDLFTQSCTLLLNKDQIEISKEIQKYLLVKKHSRFFNII